MRLATLLILGLLVGCSGAPDTDSSESSGGDTPIQSDLPTWSDNEGSGSGGPCGNAVQVIKLSTPDGGVVVTTIPIPCNPDWIDKGDPPPDRQREQVVDPNPREINPHQVGPQIRQ